VICPMKRDRSPPTLAELRRGAAHPCIAIAHGCRAACLPATGRTAHQIARHADVVRMVRLARAPAYKIARGKSPTPRGRRPPHQQPVAHNPSLRVHVDAAAGANAETPTVAAAV
jgi:hypothetical protein